MIAAPGAAGIGEDQNALLVIHECRGLSEIGRGRAGSRRPAGRPPSTFADDPARAAGDFCDHVRPETLDDLIKRARNRRQRGQMFDQASRRATASRHSTGWPSRIDRARRQIALAIGEGLIELHREGMRKVIEDIFPAA